MVKSHKNKKKFNNTSQSMAAHIKTANSSAEKSDMFHQSNNDKQNQQPEVDKLVTIVSATSQNAAV